MRNEENACTPARHQMLCIACISRAKTVRMRASKPRPRMELLVEEIGTWPHGPTDQDKGSFTLASACCMFEASPSPACHSVRLSLLRSLCIL
jgi:hypothetical protein